ncbi:hypothetical protein BN1708_018875, partial [Verticillium longisporum]
DGLERAKVPRDCRAVRVPQRRHAGRHSDGAPGDLAL